MAMLVPVAVPRLRDSVGAMMLMMLDNVFSEGSWTRFSLAGTRRKRGRRRMVFENGCF
jgi:hypothetical protein